MTQPSMRQLWEPQNRALSVGLVLTITVVASESLAVITVMPVAARDLDGIGLYGWVFSAFMLTSVIGIVAAGREADRRGPAVPFGAGLVLFGTGLLMAGLATSMVMLIAGRAIQGLGAGVVPSVAYSSIGRSLPAPLRARMIALISTAWIAPGLAGPAVSAAVARAFGWRFVFLGLVPVVAITGSIAMPALVRLGKAAASEASQHRLLDAVRACAGTALVLTGLTIGFRPEGIVAAGALVAGGAIVGVPAVRRLVPPGTLTARRGLPATVLSRGLLTFAFFGADGYVTLSVTALRHNSPLVAGLAVSGATVAWTAGAWTQARLSGSWQARRLIRTGLALVLAGIGGMTAMLLPEVPVAEGIAAWTVAGFGMGLAYSPILLLVLLQAPAGREGRESASVNLAEVLGTAVGIGIGGAAVAASVPGRLQLGLAAAFGIAGGVGVLALLTVRRLPAGTTSGSPAAVQQAADPDRG